MEEGCCSPISMWRSAILGHAEVGGPCVFEHILVRDLLGRYLLGGENVHHRNGLRDHSWPENLELWTNPQPSGA
jgi:hypothetical protein